MKNGSAMNTEFVSLIIFFDDMINNIEMANNFKWTGIWINKYYTIYEALYDILRYIKLL